MDALARLAADASVVPDADHSDDPAAKAHGFQWAMGHDSPLASAAGADLVSAAVFAAPREQLRRGALHQAARVVLAELVVVLPARRSFALALASVATVVRVAEQRASQRAVVRPELVPQREQQVSGELASAQSSAPQQELQLPGQPEPALSVPSALGREPPLPEPLASVAQAERPLELAQPVRQACAVLPSPPLLLLPCRLWLWRPHRLPPVPGLVWTLELFPLHPREWSWSASSFR